MRDRSKQLLVINTGKKESEQTRLPAQSGTTHIIGGGGLSVNMSDYLLKSIWDKVFEIRTDGQGTEYIFGKIPVVTQYGITMYSGDGVDVPSLASGLPFDGRTIWYNPGTQQIEVIGGTGGGSGEGVSNFWDLSGIPSWITDSKPKYTYSEIEGTPDLTQYATESWVLGKSYITSTILGTELAKYVTLDTDQSLKGKKNFKNGLSIDGLELRKSQDDVVYIDANLVVRGGVTMYAQNEVDIPSIIDSIPTASTTVKGIASFDGTYFSVVNGKVSLIASNVGLNEEELYNYLTSNNYAKKSDIPSLVGYATESWVNIRIDSLINGAPTAYDTLKEIADVLQGNVNSIGDIITALGTKWTQDNNKIANWDTAYSWGNHANAGYALKTYVDSELTKYVTLGDTQTITGEKNFTGGLKVNGSPIVYDSTKKYWKLEGDLLVTGGITMYGNEGTYTPSTIMDAIAVDGVTISKSGGVLKVIGGTGGGVADSVAWANITGKPTFASVATSGKYSDLSGTPSSLPASDVYSWAKAANKPSYTWSEITSKPTWIGTSKPSYSYSEITGAISTTELQNYLTQNSYLNVTSGDNKYLKLSGGTLSNTLTISNYNVGLILYRSGKTTPYMRFGENANNEYGEIGVYNDGSLVYWPLVSTQGGYGKWNTVWHSGNFNPSNYLPLSGGTLTNTLTITRSTYPHIVLNSTADNGDSCVRFDLKNVLKGYVGYSSAFGVYLQNSTTNKKLSLYDDGSLSYGGSTIWHAGNDGSGSGLDADLLDGKQPNELNVGSATKLQTVRTIWGHSFDGTEDIFGQLYLNASKIVWHDDDNNYYIGCPIVTGGAMLEYKAYSGHAFLGGNVGIGTENPSYKLDVNGITQSTALKTNSLCFECDSSGNASGKSGEINRYVGNLYLQYDTDKNLVLCQGGGKVGIGINNPSAKLHVSGDILATGAMTFYSMRKLKNVVDEKGLSLSELSAIKPTRYTWKDGRDNRLHFGGIADDIQQVLPEVVYKTSDGILTMDYGNAAFAVASSLIQPVVDHENRIAMLEEENKQLRLEVERFKSA